MSTPTTQVDIELREIDRLREEVAMLRAENRKLRQAQGEASEPAFRVPDEAHWLKMIASVFAQQGSIDRMFEEFSHQLRQLLGVEEAAVFLMDHDEQKLRAMVDRDDRKIPVQLRIGQGIAGWVAQERRSANIKDVNRDSRCYRPLGPYLGFFMRASICVPVLDRSGTVSAVIQLWNPVGRQYFSIREEQLLWAMGAVLGVLVESSQLFMSELRRNAELLETREQLEARVNELDRLYEFSTRLTAAETLEDELEVTAEAALEMVPSEICLVSIVDDGESTTWISGPDPELPLRMWREPRKSVYYRALEGCQAQRLKGDDIDENELFDVLGLDKRSHVIVPLHVEGRCLGAIELLNRYRDSSNGTYAGFRNKDVRLLTVLATQFSAMIANSMERRGRERNERIAAIGTMVGGIFHDLKTPLTIASGYVQLMQRSDDEGTRQRFGQAVQKQFDHIQQMIREVIAYARGEMELFERNVHLSLFARELNEWLTHEFDGFGVTVRVDARYDGDARFDEGKLKRVLFNLARNARDAMREQGGSYVVTITKEDDLLKFVCTDTGPGIPAHVQRRLFQAFVSTGKAERSGLGLAIVKKLMTEMNGWVSFESTLGVGTEFTLAVPFREVSEEASASV